MSELCVAKCRVVNECNSRTAYALIRQKQLIFDHSNLVEAVLADGDADDANSTTGTANTLDDNPELQQKEAELREHITFIGKLAAGAAMVGFGQRECKTGPTRRLKPDPILAGFYLSSFYGHMSLRTTQFQQEQTADEPLQCSSQMAIAGLQSMPQVSNPLER